MTSTATFNIRRLEPGDMGDLFEIYSTKEVIENTSQAPFLSRQQVDALFSPNNRHTLVAEDHDRVVGNVSLILPTKPREKHCAAVAIAVDPQYHRQGIGEALLREAIEQADQWFNLVRLELDVLSNNSAAIALYEKLGFEREGEKRMATFRNGEYADLVFMARLREAQQ